MKFSPVSVHLLICTLAMLLCQQSAFAQRDQVFGLRGTPTSGTITAVSPSGITLQVGSSSKVVPLNEIQRVTFDGEPNELRRAREAAHQGRFEDARAELDKLNVADLRRDFVRQDVEYYSAYLDSRMSLTEGGNKDAALEALLTFVRRHPQSYHFYEAAETLGDLAVALGKNEDAVRYYAALAKAPWPEYKLRSAMLEARAQGALQQWDAAQQRYDSVLASELDTPEVHRLKLLATVGRAVTVAHKGHPQEAIETLQGVVAQNDSSDVELFSRAYNALGTCYVLAQQPQEALLAYLHVDLLFFGDPEEHAEALFHLSKLWNEVNKPDRAVTARNMLQTRYAGTAWARQL